MQNTHTTKGSVLVFSLIILTLLLITGITVMNVAVVEKKAAFATQRSVIAFQGADSGAERILKRIYRDDSPTIGPPDNVILNSLMPDNTPYYLLEALQDPSSGGGIDASGVSSEDWDCSYGSVNLTAKNDREPEYSFIVNFYEEDGSDIDCNDHAWRDKVVKMKVTGFYRNTERSIEVGIRPRE